MVDIAAQPQPAAYSATMKFVDGYVRSPLAGLAPWILMGIINGPGRFEEAASVALALSLLTLWVGVRRGVPVHLLEVFTVAYFGVLAVLGLAASDGAIEWLQLWAGALSSVALAAFAIVTLLARRPFTLAYAKDTTPEEYWDSPIFLRINYVISAAWAGAFLFSAIVGVYGDAVLGDNDNFWTAWVLPIGALIFAVSFTEFYPDYAMGETASVAGVFDWFPPFVTAVGIIGWVTDALPDAVAIALIAAGVVGSAVMRKLVPDKPEPEPTAPQ
ncbi:membrane protein [Mycobacterium holsaticum DSM 44478]|nr:membrane protein [Mycolicibacterium holsaticum DSM 44478 = JCM 12374]